MEAIFKMAVKTAELKSLKNVGADEPMKVDLITDQIIEIHKLKEVTDPLYFEKGNIPRVGGLFSEYIFGSSQEEKKKTSAYIDLGGKYFQPYMYEKLISIQRNIEKVCHGDGAWIIDEDGNLKEDKKADPSVLIHPNSGISWLIKNFRKIKFKKNQSYKRNSVIDLLNNLADDELFITKWLVVPVFYRDVDLSAGSTKAQVPIINNSYASLIRYRNSIVGDEAIGFEENMAKFNIQTELVKIRKYGQTLIEKKTGFFKRSVLGKSIDYGARSVISTPIINEAELPEDMPGNLYNTGLPLGRCCILGFPFIARWIAEFFRKEFESRGVNYPIYFKDKAGNLTLKEVQFDDPLGVYTEDFIMKKIRAFIDTPESRFDLVTLPTRDKTDAYMVFTGRGYSRDKDNPMASTISSRPLTWTDVIYMAAYNTLTPDKHVYITRYPLTDYFGTFPSRVHVLSTLKTFPVIIGDEVYSHYPLIDIKMPKEQIPTQFIDTTTMSNMYLAGIQGDYDGDMVSMKMTYSQEANEEADKLLFHKRHYVSIKGELVRTIEKEAYLTFYNMTKYED
jgi:hypothetical protein